MVIRSLNIFQDKYETRVLSNIGKDSECLEDIFYMCIWVCGSWSIWVCGSWSNGCFNIVYALHESLLFSSCTDEEY